MWSTKNLLILYMRSIIVSKNKSWPRLIWPTLYRFQWCTDLA